MRLIRGASGCSCAGCELHGLLFFNERFTGMGPPVFFFVSANRNGVLVRFGSNAWAGLPTVSGIVGILRADRDKSERKWNLVSWCVEGILCIVYWVRSAQHIVYFANKVCNKDDDCQSISFFKQERLHLLQRLSKPNVLVQILPWMSSRSSPSGISP